MDRLLGASCFGLGTAWLAQSVSAEHLDEQQLRYLVAGAFGLVGVIAWYCPLCSFCMAAAGMCGIAGIDQAFLEGLFLEVLLFVLPFLLIPLLYLALGDNPLKYRL